MITPPHLEDDTNRIMEALAHAATGNRPAALEQLKPIVTRGPQSTYATLCALAEMAVFDHKPTPGTFLGPAVEQDGRLAGIGALPDHLQFAARFVAAHANRDYDTRDALFRVLAVDDTDRGVAALAQAFAAVFDMAAATARHIVETGHAKRHKPDA